MCIHIYIHMYIHSNMGSGPFALLCMLMCAPPTLSFTTTLPKMPRPSPPPHQAQRCRSLRPVTHFTPCMCADAGPIEMKAKKTIAKHKTTNPKKRTSKIAVEVAGAGAGAQGGQGIWDVAVSLQSLRERQATFAKDRKWDPHHTPRCDI